MSPDRNSNVTGFVSGDVWLNAKRMELLKEAISTATRVAILANPTNPSFAQEIGEADKAARSLKIQTSVTRVSDPTNLPKAFADIENRQINALLVVPDGMLWARREDIVKLAAQGRLPAMYWTSDYTDAGGLMSYAESLNDLGKRAAGYVDRILKSAKPGDLPIEQPTKFKLVINVKTAKALGLTMPPTLPAAGGSGHRVIDRRRFVSGVATILVGRTRGRARPRDWRSELLTLRPSLSRCCHTSAMVISHAKTSSVSVSTLLLSIGRRWCSRPVRTMRRGHLSGLRPPRRSDFHGGPRHIVLSRECGKRRGTVASPPEN